MTGAGADSMGGASQAHRSFARTQASQGAGAGGEPFPMLVWGCLDTEGGCEAREDVGLTVKVESDGEGEEHRMDVCCATLRVHLVPSPVLRLINVWLTITYIHPAEAANFSAAPARAATRDGGPGAARPGGGTGEAGGDLGGIGRVGAVRRVKALDVMPTWRRRVLALIQSSLEQVW